MTEEKKKERKENLLRFWKEKISGIQKFCIGVLIGCLFGASFMYFHLKPKILIDGKVEDGEMLVEGMHISPYDHGSYFNTDPLRPKRLLLHKNEIRKLAQQVQKQGYTLIPLSVYLKNGRMKLSLGVCVGKHLHDKRDAMAEKSAKRDMERALKTH